VLPPAKAGVGSAVNDATREAGGTLGVAVLGSIFTGLYAHRLSSTAFGALPAQVRDAAQNSLAAAFGTVRHASTGAAQQRLLDGVHTSFMHGFHTASLVGGAICVAGAAGALLLPGRTAASAASTVVAEDGDRVAA
ncbi:MAG TPA: MFS transporter, partial [Micromonosporaceae bacterium]